MTQHVGMRIFNDFLKATNMRKKMQVLRQKMLALRQKMQGLQQNVKIHSLVFRILARAWQMQKKSCSRLFADYQAIIGRLSII